MGNNYFTDKACSRFINSVSEGFRKCQKEEVNKARFLSVISDGSTDAGIHEEEPVYVRYILNGSALIQFADVKKPDKADAAEILKVVKKKLLVKSYLDLLMVINEVIIYN